jgi:radical SAM protein with 4Fe4S-binding SPASM domain
LEGVTVAGISEKLVRLYKECELLGIEWFWTWTAPFLNIKHKSALEWEVPYFCSAVKGRSMAVSGNGNVTTCSYTTTKIGNIDSIKFGIQSQLGELIHSRTPGVNPFCQWCAIEGHCGWQCHATREVAMAQWNKEILPKMCELYRATTSMLLAHELTKV